MYGAESWVTFRRHVRFLEQSTMQQCFRTILYVRWSDFDNEMQKFAQSTSIDVPYT